LSSKYDEINELLKLKVLKKKMIFLSVAEIYLCELLDIVFTIAVTENFLSFFD